MDLPGNLAKQFAKAIAADDSGRHKAETVAYGTVVVQGDETYVRLDGSDNLTPVAKAMDAVDGDRVVVSIRNHNAVITGNISSPASARTASSYMKLTEDGLAVGELDEDGEPVGTYSLIGSGMYRIVDENGNTVALFSDGKILLLGDIGTAKGSIRMIDGVLLLTGTDAVGTRTTHTDENSVTQVGEAVCIWDATSSKVASALRAYVRGGREAAVIVSPNKIDLNTDYEGEVYANGFEVLTTSRLMLSGIVNFTGKIKANSYRTFSYEVASIPDRYQLSGISQITTYNRGTTSHNKECHINEFFTHPSIKKVGVTIYNESSSAQTIDVRLEWFALYSNQDNYLQPINITLPDEP